MIWRHALTIRGKEVGCTELELLGYDLASCSHYTDGHYPLKSSLYTEDPFAPPSAVSRCRDPHSAALKGHGMEVRCTSSKNPRVVRLPNELVAEILARVPYHSLCQFKCVSQSWRAICSNPAVFRRCPQTLAGFFFRTMPLGDPRYVRHFINASGRGPPMVNPSLSFLPPGYSCASFLGSCNGLLLCRCDDIRPQPQVAYRYFVCNPATERWIGLPDPEVTKRTYYLRAFRLGFDPTVSSHFRVFVLESDSRRQQPRDQVTGVEIFSSETRAWSYRQSKWGDGNGAVVGWNSVFFKGTLHLTSPSSSSLLTVDMDGRAWGRIPTPHDFGFIGVSQGRLHAVHRWDNGRDDDYESINIWVLEDYVGQQWTLKHAVTVMEMYGAHPRSFGNSYSFIVHAVHLEHDVIYLTASKLRSLMSYDMDKKKVRFIWTLGESNLSTHPYVPCFSDWLSDGH